MKKFFAEADNNFPSGESLVRQILLGKFGIETPDAWLPDVFGCNAALPQILKKSGVKHFIARKIPGKQFEDFPHHAFWWEGIDGTRILTHLSPADKVSDLFPKTEENAHDLPVWVGELCLELDPGTCTTHAAEKKGNRKSEFLLRDAEFFDVIAGERAPLQPLSEERAIHDVSAKGCDTPAAYLDRAWKLVLLNQSHVHEHSARDYAKIAILGKAVSEAARADLAAKIDTTGFTTPFIVFNTCSFQREEVISLPEGPPLHVQVPACGYAVVEGDDQRPVASFAKPVEIFDRKKVLAIDNGMLRIIFDRHDGTIRSIRDHRVRREVLAPGHCGNVFELHRDCRNNRDEAHEEIDGFESIDVFENTPLRATVRIARTFGKSRIVQKISLCAGSPRIDFDTEVDWHEERKFFKVAFPVNVRSIRATYEIPFGHVELPTHRNTSCDRARSEVCAQKWCDLSEGDYGVALLNDCKYGHDIFENVIRLHLLSAPTAPDAEADRGTHQFTYALVPHLGDFRAGGIVQHAYALNVPLQILSAEAHDGSLQKSQTFFQIDRAGAIIEAIKKAENEDAVIVRFYEAYGTRGPATLTTSLSFKQAFVTDLMERTLTEIDFSNGQVTVNLAPFEIVTLKFI